MVTQIRILRHQVQETQTFKNLSPVLKKITSSRNQIKAIENAVNICKNTSYKKWEKNTNAQWRIREIVKDLLEKES